MSTTRESPHQKTPSVNRLFRWLYGIYRCFVATEDRPHRHTPWLYNVPFDSNMMFDDRLASIFALV